LSLENIFESRILYISDAYLTGKYIKYIRPINQTEELKYSKKYYNKTIKFPLETFKKKRDNQLNYYEFTKICNEEKLLNSNKIDYDGKPLISIVIPTYNKEDILIKSLRSIQNQSFKNIEIIILNDNSKDNTSKHFQYLLKTDPRIRIFNHLKNMGCWRSRIDGILYSKGKYILLFDPGDWYEDNYVLEDAFNLIENYNLDSVKFLYRRIKSINTLNKSGIYHHVYQKSKIVYGSSNVQKYNKMIFKGWNSIWNRIVRANIYIKGLCLLNDITLNIYKNAWDDIWFNKIIDETSYSLLIVERIAYVYLNNGEGESAFQAKTDFQKDRLIKEYLGFLYFKYNMLPKTDKKYKIIKALKEYNKSSSKIKLSFIKSKFFILNDLLSILIGDPYVSKKDKIFLNKLLNESKKREIEMPINDNSFYL
jgi:glycosyltransferase involved in cell wall biosynthesis